MVARVLPSVVSITTRQIERDQFNQPVPTRGLGSGFVIAREGYVLTNIVHIYDGKTTALHGVVEVAEDPDHPWALGRCGVVVEEACIEP